MNRFTQRPRLLRVANAWVPSATAFDADALMAAAARSEGRHFVSHDFAEGFRVLCANIESDARLHATGRAITRGRLVGALRTRLRLEAARENEPERFTRSMPRPIIICGLPRTGTTLLHRLLAGAGLRALRTWEALDPVPGPERRKIRQAQLAERALAAMAPSFFAVHPIDAGGVEEEVLLFEPTFHSMVPPATMRVPGYLEWYERTDATPAYREVRAILAGLGGGERWVLKTPQHVEWLDVLAATFPDALLVWTHRDPREVAPSYFSLIAHGRGVLSDEVDPREIGSEWRRKLRRMITRGLAARARLGDDRFVDVPYRQLVADPHGTVLDLLRRADWEITEATHFGIASARRRQTPGRHGAHRYALEDFGISPTAIDDDLAAYRDQHGDHF